MNKKILLVEGDYDDGDFIKKETPIKEKDLVKLKEILKKVEKDNYNQISWETGDIGDLSEQHNELTEDEKDILDSYCPHGSHGIHTIESIRILEIVSDINLLK